MLGLKYKVGKDIKFHPLTEEDVCNLMNSFIGEKDETPEVCFEKSLNYITDKINPEEFDKVKEYHLGVFSITKIRPISTFVEDK